MPLDNKIQLNFTTIAKKDKISCQKNEKFIYPSSFKDPLKNLEELTNLWDLPTEIYFGLWSSTPRVIVLFTLLYYLPAPYALRYLWKEIQAGR